jgi:ATP-binding cassette subfamily C protein
VTETTNRATPAIASERSAAAARFPVAGGRRTWDAVRESLNLSRRELVAGDLVLVIACLVGFVAPIALGRLVDVVSSAHGTDTEVVGLFAAMVAAAVVGGALNGFTYSLTAGAMEAGLARLRERMVRRALTLPWSVVERAGTGDLVSRASNDVRQVADAGPRVVNALTTALLTIVLTFVAMAGVNPWFALALLVILPVHVITVRWYLRTVPGLYVAERAALADSSRSLLSGLRGHDTVIAYRLNYQHIAGVASTSWATAEWSIRARRMVNRFFSRLNFAEFLGMSALLLTGFWLVHRDAASLGEATTAVLFFLRLFNPINQLLFVVDDMQSAAASLSRIVGVIDVPGASDLDLESLPPPHADSATTAGHEATVRVRDLRFHYQGGPDVLHRIDLTLSHGEHVALVGTTGAGKSTLAGLICGLHEPVDGEVSVAAPPVLLTQETHVFNASLRENLTLARPEATDEDVLAACRRVGADAGLVRMLPQGLDTPVGAGGLLLTGQQTQLLALARLVLLDPAVAVLDEATAEAGSSAADELDAAAAAALSGRTALVVAHRLSQAARTDRVVVLEHGRIVEQGTHADLAAGTGRYAGLWRAWSRHRAPLSDRVREPGEGDR